MSKHIYLGIRKETGDAIYAYHVRQAFHSDIRTAVCDRLGESHINMHFVIEPVTWDYCYRIGEDNERKEC